jgi:hypothetical protein
MICEQCHNRDALVHLTSSQQMDSATIEFFQHDYCPSCAEELHVEEQGTPPRTATDRDIKEEMRIVGSADDSVTVEILRSDGICRTSGRRLVCKQWIPSNLQNIGTELVVISTPEAIKWFYEHSKE